MKKILLSLICAFFALSVFAQDSLVSVTPPRMKEKTDLSNRANDHILFQIGYLGWSGKPDTLNTRGFSKSINVYIMYDFPFKTNPHLSMAFGPGIGTDGMIFSKTLVGIKDLTSTFRFTDQSDTAHFKKTKLQTAYLEAPVEFRYSADPLHGRGLKMAIGVKIGTLINAHTRNTKYESATGSTINDYSMKESSKRFFNKNRLSAQARVGYGHFSLYGAYQISALLKDGSGPVIHPFSIGLTLSGL